MRRPVLLVFVKAPAIGRGKTRLAAGAGRVEALRINRFLQARAMKAACDPRWRTILCVAPDRADCGLWPRAVERRAQGRGDLGERLARAFRTHQSPLAVVGADAPDMTALHVARGFAALRRAPYALGPALDGGFWFFAARAPKRAARAFAGVRWSTEHAAADLRARLDGGCAEVDRLRDIDDLEDWREWRKSS